MDATTIFLYLCCSSIFRFIDWARINPFIKAKKCGKHFKLYVIYFFSGGKARAIVFMGYKKHEIVEIFKMSYGETGWTIRETF